MLELCEELVRVEYNLYSSSNLCFFIHIKYVSRAIIYEVAVLATS